MAAARRLDYPAVPASAVRLQGNAKRLNVSTPNLPSVSMAPPLLCAAVLATLLVAYTAGHVKVTSAQAEGRRIAREIESTRREIANMSRRITVLRSDDETVRWVAAKGYQHRPPADQLVLNVKEAR